MPFFPHLIPHVTGPGTSIPTHHTLEVVSTTSPRPRLRFPPPQAATKSPSPPKRIPTGISEIGFSFTRLSTPNRFNYSLKTRYPARHHQGATREPPTAIPRRLQRPVRLHPHPTVLVTFSITWRHPTPISSLLSSNTRLQLVHHVKGDDTRLFSIRIPPPASRQRLQRIRCDDELLLPPIHSRAKEHSSGSCPEPSSTSSTPPRPSDKPQPPASFDGTCISILLKAPSAKTHPGSSKTIVKRQTSLPESSRTSFHPSTPSTSAADAVEVDELLQTSTRYISASAGWNGSKIKTQLNITLLYHLVTLLATFVTVFTRYCIQ